MKIIGENIHIVSPRVKEALADKNLKFFQEGVTRYRFTRVQQSLDLIETFGTVHALTRPATRAREYTPSAPR